MNIKKFVSLFLVALSLISVILFSSCNITKTSEENSTKYEYTPGGQETTSSIQNDTAIEQEITIDRTWQMNFSVSYRYYNPEQSLTTMKIVEKRSSGAFTVENSDINSLLYYKANGNDTDYYVIIDNEDEQVHSVLAGKKLSSLSSMFMKLSEVSRDFPSQNNVLYMYNETVAGRNCYKYIQRAYSDGKLTQSVYVWIDAEYGFAAKCEAYDENNTLDVMWEIESFETGSLKDEDVFVDVSKYTFKENVG